MSSKQKMDRVADKGIDAINELRDENARLQAALEEALSWIRAKFGGGTGRIAEARIRAIVKGKKL